MEFSTLCFLFLYMPIIVMSQIFICNNNLSNLLLVLFSFVFIIYYQIEYLLFYLFLMILTYVFGFIVKANKRLLSIYIFILLGVLGFFKYYNLFNIVIDKNILNLIMPLGLSFFTFTSIGYVIDVYKEVIKPEKNIINFFVFNNLFAVFISGPIIKYSDVKNDIHDRTINLDYLAIGLRRFIIGLGKKTIINLLNPIAK